MSGRRRQLTVERSPVIAWNVQTFHGAPYPDMPAAAAISPVVPAASDPYGRCWQNQVDAGSCFPYFGNIYSSSLPPPSSFRVQPSCVTNLGQFWPPTPPPDGCGRYEASNNFYFCPPPMTPVFTHNEAIPQSIHGSLPRLSHYSHIIETQKEHNIHSSGLKLESSMSPKCSLPHMTEVCPPVSKYEAQSSIQVSDSGLKKADSNQSNLCNQVSVNVEKSAQKAHYSACHYMECEGRSHSGDLIRGNDKENIHNSSLYNSYNPDPRAASGKLKHKNCETNKRDHLNFLHFKNPHYQSNQSVRFDGTQNSMLSNNHKEHTSAQYGVGSPSIDTFNKNTSVLELNNVHCREELRTRKVTDSAVSMSQPVAPMISTVSAIPVSGLSSSTTSSMISLDNCSHHSSHVPTSGYNTCSSIPLQIQMFSDAPISHRKACCFSPPHALSRTLFQHPVTEVAKSNLKQNSYMAYGSNYSSSPLKNVYFSHLESESVGKYASKAHKTIAKNVQMNHEKYFSNQDSPYENAKLMPMTEKTRNACGGIPNSDGIPNSYMSCIVECPVETQPKGVSSLDTLQKSEKRKLDEVMFVLDQRKKSRRVKVKTEKNETTDCRFQKSNEYPLLNLEGPGISNALNLSVSRSPKSEPEDNYVNQIKISLNSADLAASSVPVSCNLPVTSISPVDSFTNFHSGHDFNGSEKNIPVSSYALSVRVSEANASNFEFTPIGYSTIQPVLSESLVSATRALPREKPDQETFIKNGTCVSNDFDKTSAISENPSTKTDSQVSFHAPPTSNDSGDYYMMQNGSKSDKCDQYGYSLKQDKVEKVESLTTSKIKPLVSRVEPAICNHNSFDSGDTLRITNSNACESVENSNMKHEKLFAINSEDVADLNKEQNYVKVAMFDNSTNSQELTMKCVQNNSDGSKDLIGEDELFISKTKFTNVINCESGPSEGDQLQCDSREHAFRDQPLSPLEGICSQDKSNSEHSTDVCNSDINLSCVDVITATLQKFTNNANISKQLSVNVDSSDEKLKIMNALDNQESNTVEVSENHGFDLLICSIEQMERNQNVERLSNCYGENSNSSLFKLCSQRKSESENLKENSVEQNGVYSSMPNTDSTTSVKGGFEFLCVLAEQHYASEFCRQEKVDEKTADNVPPNYPMIKMENIISKYALNQAAEEISESAELQMRKGLAELQRKYKEKQKELARLKPKKMSLDKSGKGQACKKYPAVHEVASDYTWPNSPIHTDENNSGFEFSSNSNDSLPLEKNMKSAGTLALDDMLLSVKVGDTSCKTKKIHNYSDRRSTKQSSNKQSKCEYEEQATKLSDVLNLNGSKCLTGTKLRNSKILPFSTVLRKKQNSLYAEETNMLKVTRHVVKKTCSESSADIRPCSDQNSFRKQKANKTRLRKALPENFHKGKMPKSEDAYNSSTLNLPHRSPKRLKTVSEEFLVTASINGSPDLNRSRPVANKRKAENPRKYSPLKQENITETLVTKQLRNRILINEESSGPSEEQDGVNGISEELFDAFRKCHLNEDLNSLDTAHATTKHTFGGEAADSKLADNCPVQELSMLKPIHLLEKQRVIAMEDGLFYAGHIKVIQPPDVYGIVLDGERGTKPHVFSCEEIMKAAMLEVKPNSVTELPERTRVCAYWSQQYRCLYPGTVTKASKTKVESSEPWVFVEFDDGDSGQIPIKNIRLLPPDLQLFEMEDKSKDISLEQVNGTPESSMTKVTSNRKRKAQRETSKVHQKHKSSKKQLMSTRRGALIETCDSNDELRNISEGNTVPSHTSDSQSTENCTEIIKSYTSDIAEKLPQRSLKKTSKRKGGSKAKSKDIALQDKSKKHKEKRKHHHRHHHHHHHHHRHHRHCHHHHHCKKHKRRKKGDCNTTISQGNPDVVIPSSSIPDKNFISKLSCHSPERDCNDCTGHSSLELPQQLLENSSTETGAKLLDQNCTDAEVCENKPVLRRNHRSVQRSSMKFPIVATVKLVRAVPS